MAKMTKSSFELVIEYNEDECGDEEQMTDAIESCLLSFAQVLNFGVPHEFQAKIIKFDPVAGHKPLLTVDITPKPKR